MREHSSVVVIGGGIYWIPDASESLPCDTQYATRGTLGVLGMILTEPPQISQILIAVLN